MHLLKEGRKQAARLFPFFSRRTEGGSLKMIRSTKGRLEPEMRDFFLPFVIIISWFPRTRGAFRVDETVC